MTDIMVTDASAIESTVRSAATGDEFAFAQLVAAHHAPMSRVAFVICGDAETTRDAVQSAWTIAWRRIGTLRDPSQVRAWLIAIAANEARQAMRRGRRVTLVDISDDLARADGADADQTIALVDLQRVLNSLSSEELSLLAMRYAAGLESGDIARQLGMSASGVRSRLARLLDRLRHDLALESEDDR